LRDSELADLIGNATRRAFANLVELCLNEQVDALLLAGDLYDGEQTSMKTARFLAGQIRRLHEAGIQVSGAEADRASHEVQLGHHSC
jgi:exonuclease SbcD